MSTLVNDALMRPIKQLQQATHFRRVEKKVLIDQLKNEMEGFCAEDEDEDLNGSVWMPVLVDNKQEKDSIIQDPNVKEMDLAAISEKEVFVRKANLVIIKAITNLLYRVILRRASIIVNLQYMLVS